MAAPGSLRWSFHVAQRSLGDIIRRALVDGPQLIHHDTGDVVVIPIEEYERLAGTTGASLGEFLRVSPLADAENERRRFVERPSPAAPPIGDSTTA
jgi:prevent-host-death family protein